MYKTIAKRSMLSMAIMGVLVLGSFAQQAEETLDLENYKKELLSAEDLSDWNFWGMGSAFAYGGGQFCLTENDSTVGAILISPESYAGDLILRYKTYALTSATVLVVMHSMSDLDSGDKLTIPKDYNGNMGLWVSEKENYFYAFRNAAHAYPPFIRRYPVPGNEALVMAQENFMLPGVYYSIEIGRVGQKLWLSVDGKQIIETEDRSILPGGHIAFRIRGSAGYKAACLIKDVEIYSENK
jgi:hypothetical protein